MKLRKLSHSDISISSIIMGTWQAGKENWAGIDDREIDRALKTAFVQGITTFDTAEQYGRGHSERMLGKALADQRKNVIFATKVSHNHLRRHQVMEACHRSLKNLQTDYIDIYQIHWPSGSWGSKVIALEETLGAMIKLKQQGKICEIGVSNFSLQELKEAQQYAPIVSMQQPYSLFWRQIEEDTLPWSRENAVTTLAYSSLAQGILTGKFGVNHQFPKGDHRFKNRLFHSPYVQAVQNALHKLRPLSQELGISLSQLAIAWVISQPGVCAIVGARNAEQIRENSTASEISLSADDLEKIEIIGKTVTDLLDDNPVLWG